MTTSPTEHPCWQQIYATYRNQIEAGDLAPGERLPPLSEISQIHGLSPHQARRVVERLRDGGYVTSWHGKGTFVAGTCVRYQIGPRTRFGDIVRGQDMVAGTQIISLTSRRASTSLTRALRLKRGARVDQAEILRTVGTRPAMLAQHSYPAGAFDGILDHLARTGSVTAALKACGIEDFVRRETTIQTRLPSGHEALVLGIPPSQPFLSQQVSMSIWKTLRSRSLKPYPAAIASLCRWEPQSPRLCETVSQDRPDT